MAMFQPSVLILNIGLDIKMDQLTIMQVSFSCVLVLPNLTTFSSHIYWDQWITKMTFRIPSRFMYIIITNYYWGLKCKDLKLKPRLHEAFNLYSNPN